MVVAVAVVVAVDLSERFEKIASERFVVFIFACKIGHFSASFYSFDHFKLEFALLSQYWFILGHF